jgi:hypothetical protein
MGPKPDEAAAQARQAAHEAREAADAAAADAVAAETAAEHAEEVAAEAAQALTDDDISESETPHPSAPPDTDADGYEDASESGGDAADYEDEADAADSTEHGGGYGDGLSL